MSPRPASRAWRATRASCGAGPLVFAAIVAPVTIGAGAYVGTGTVVTRDVPEDALAIARTEQTNHDGMAKRLRAKLRARAGKTDKE